MGLMGLFFQNMGLQGHDAQLIGHIAHSPSTPGTPDREPGK
jgi:hypothetical protein